MSVALNLLASSRPDWFAQTSLIENELKGVAHVEETMWHVSGVPLVMRDIGVLTVAEQVPGQVFPARCPERHIQSDRTFCVGLRKIQIVDAVTAAQWWEQLRQYLICQSVAEQTGVWPLPNALDHGEAGTFHERALSLAADLGLEAEYDAAYLSEPSWITDEGLKLLDKQGRAINGRMPCPRRCPHKRGGKHIILRRKCPRRSKLLELVRLERHRRQALDRYWAQCVKAGETCCGKMRKCGFPRLIVEQEEGANVEVRR